MNIDRIATHGALLADVYYLMTGQVLNHSSLKIRGRFTIRGSACVPYCHLSYDYHADLVYIAGNAK